MALNTGQILQARYHIISHIGRGGMGAVYQAQDMRLNQRLVAVKEFDPAQLPPTDRQIALQAFQQEAAILATLSHPGLTAVHDYFFENNQFYLVMEFVSGETLQQAWERVGRRFAETQVIAWAQELCDVLSYLHSQQPPVVFRDLKPGNIMVQPNGRLKLIDFGIARHFTPGKTSDTVKFGTPGYAAPEQYGQGQTDARSDVYALGVVTHQLLTGHDPTATPFHLPSLSQLAPQISPSVNHVVTQALEMDPAKRPSTAHLFATGLHTRPLSTADASQNGRKPSIPLWLWGVMGGLALLFLLGGGWLWRNSQTTPPEIIEETIVVTQPAAAPTKPSEDDEDELATAVPTTSVPTPEVQIVMIAPTETVAPEPTNTLQPASTPTVTPQPTPTRTAVMVSRPSSSQTNMTSIWQGIDFEDMQSPGTNRYRTTLSADETRRWSFIWCGRTRADLENIIAPLTFSMLLNGQAISDEQILVHDEVVNGWQCRYWSTLLHSWVSGQTVEVEAYYQVGERIFDGEGYYEPGTYRQIITVQAR
jgi:serine/threonine protein kinase